MSGNWAWKSSWASCKWSRGRANFPSKGHFKTKARISIWLMNSLSQLWKTSKTRRLITTVDFGITFIGAVQPGTQMGHPRGWCLIKFTHLLPQPEPFFLLFCLFYFTSLLFKQGTSSHTTLLVSVSAASAGCPQRERHKPTTPATPWTLTRHHWSGGSQKPTPSPTRARHWATAALQAEQMVSSSTCSPQSSP